ncbi:ribonuclease HII [Thermosipho ferrireducens]|uniref:Ribonuclease HII n=1 Tax=Thermosipho ferrireducens TaxID=2571116 RepID=A0ABX7S5W3_9BACT|nr:ribonuclease HII [Thermosipho ferrireducens]QTA37961.1 ribonuclease HII [Thermosipho ferrireducens]
MKLVGVDEAGRGPLFGPVVAAAVYLKRRIEGLKDSKKLSPVQREKIIIEIYKNGVVGIGLATAEEIDKLNILHATELAMNRALKMLSKYISFESVLVDGKNLKLEFNHKCIVKGDEKVPAISAASIVAKVTRDKIIRAYSKIFPDYLLDTHKGYPTKKHIKLLEIYGVTPHHRLTFKSVARRLDFTQLEEWRKNGIIDEERYKKVLEKMEVPLFGIQCP